MALGLTPMPEEKILEAERQRQAEWRGERRRPR
jgi:hypothetical protein